MNRNQDSYFAHVPGIDIQRSTFDRSTTHKTSFNVGELIPIFLDEVLPGDTFQLQSNFIARMQTLLNPVMDELVLDQYYFFVPNRLVWHHWKEFCGENTQSAWIQQTTYRVPQITPPEGGWTTGTIADYMGLPVGNEYDSVNALPFRAYAMIVNEFFRDQNLQNPIYFPTGDATVVGSNGSTDFDIYKGGHPFVAGKFHDYFTSALPAPQKSSPVEVPVNLGELNLPVIALDQKHSVPRTVATLTGVTDSSISGDFAKSGSGNGLTIYEGAANPVMFDNLYATSYDDQNFGDVTVNTLRLCFSLQRFYERAARSGTRYSEFIKSQFSVDVPDSRVQRPEYLGGGRTNINFHEVVNNSQNEAEQSYLGNLGAMSVTVDQQNAFTKSFTEHGYIVGLCVARYPHSYSQGIEKLWSRHDLTDFYLPVFANIGEQPIYNREIMATASSANDQVFGYQEAWAEYRYKPNRISGEMRPGVTNSLAQWHFSDYYQSVPILSDGWIREDLTNVDRALAVSHTVSNQLFADFYFKIASTRPMPVYSVPGLIDHN